ncbi:hypothetical protein [Mycobacterium riyadhense]|uniref:hypothetical protein n=1 Tax=Mycobacterium riyadhense TaxID=486698 RepID=UPI00195D9524|nr:hypothetical protein [Mycobacterium riyadhense]
MANPVNVGDFKEIKFWFSLISLPPAVPLPTSAAGAAVAGGVRNEIHYDLAAAPYPTLQSSRLHRRGRQ